MAEMQDYLNTFDRYASELPTSSASVEDERERRESLNRRVSQEVGYRRKDGARMLAGIVMDSDQVFSKVSALIGGGDYVGAKKTYDDFRDIVRGNVNDIAGLTREEIRRSGPLGERLAAHAASILAGDYNRIEVSLSDGSKTTIGNVLGDNASFEGFKRDSLRGLGFNDDVADMYFGKYGDVARSLAQRIVDPVTSAKDAKQAPVDPIQTADLANYLSRRDGDGNMVNLDRLQNLFGNSSTLMLDGIMRSHAGAGDYSRTLDNFLKIGEAMRQPDEDGGALAARVSSAYTNLMRSTYAGLKPDGSPPSARDWLVFDSMMAKTVSSLAKRGLPADPTRPSFAASFRELADQISWADGLGVDLVAVASGVGASYLSDAGDWAAGFMAGSVSPNMYTSVAALRNGLAGVVGAKQPTERYSQRSPGATPAQKSVGAASEFTALDGLAHGFQAQVAKTLVPRIATGREPSVAMSEMLGDSAASAEFMGGLSTQVRKFMPMASPALHAALANEMFGQWSQSGGSAMCVEAAIESLLVSGRLDAASDRQLRLWTAANVDPTPEKTRWKELLSAHFLSEHPKDPGRATQRTAAAMVELEKARLRGDDTEKVLSSIIMQGRFLQRVPYTDENGRPKPHPYLVDGRGKPRTYEVGAGYGDLRKAAANAGQTLDEFYADQQYLGDLQRADAGAAKRVQDAMIRQAMAAQQAAAQAAAKNAPSVSPDDMVPSFE